MAGHPAGDRVDGVLDVDPALLEELGELADRVLRLGDREPVAGHDDDVCAYASWIATSSALMRGPTRRPRRRRGPFPRRHRTRRS